MNIYKTFIAYEYNNTSKELAKADTDDELAEELISKGVKGKVTVVEYTAYERTDDGSIPKELLDQYQPINHYDNPEAFRDSLNER